MDENKLGNQGNIIIYQTDDGLTHIDVKFEDETVWLTQAQLCELYQTSKSNISEHIKHIFEEGELEENSVVRKFRTTASDAKNYLDKNELKVLNNLVSGYFDFAEIQAMRHNPMYMSDYINYLDNLLSSTGEKLLDGAGTVSHEQALNKAKSEYRKYQNKTMSPVETAYLDTIKKINETAKQKSKTK